jgi:hypothetical protein
VIKKKPKKSNIVKKSKAAPLKKTSKIKDDLRKKIKAASLDIEQALKMYPKHFMLLVKFDDEGTYLIHKRIPTSEFIFEGRGMTCGDFQPVIKKYRCSYNIVFLIGSKHSKVKDDFLKKIIDFGTPYYFVEDFVSVFDAMFGARTSSEKEVRLCQ